MKITVHSYVVRQVEKKEKIIFMNVTPGENMGTLTVDTQSDYLIGELQKAEVEYMKPSVKP